jgi:hypothetical protein
MTLYTDLGTAVEIEGPVFTTYVSHHGPSNQAPMSADEIAEFEQLLALEGAR